MAKIRFHRVRKRFRDNDVIRELDLVIDDGEFFTFVGPSGCGKSTVLNMIAGLEDITEGEIYFDDVVVNDLPPAERDVAMVFQSYALYPHMTVYENISFPLRMRKVQAPVIDQEVRRVAGILGLDALLPRKPGELSGGQRQRVALGRAIIRKPRVFLMDEPLSNLDARLRIDMRTELKRLHMELKVTTVYVTHDQEEAMKLSDRIAVLYEGEVQQCGTPFEIYQEPSNLFVAGFFGSPPMNFIPGVLRSRAPVEIDCNGYHVSLDKALSADSSGYAGQVVIGIRPEDIRISNEREDGAVEVSVALLEPVGFFCWADCEWKEVKIRGKAELPAQLVPGDKAFMTFSKERVVIFNAETGKSLNGRGGF